MGFDRKLMEGARASDGATICAPRMRVPAAAITTIADFLELKGGGRRYPLEPALLGRGFLDGEGQHE